MSFETLLPDEEDRRVALDEPSADAVVLADGTIVDLGALGPADLLELQWEQERAFARQMLAAPKGSRERAEATHRAYETVTAIFAAQQGRSREPLLLGVHPRYGRLVIELLRRQSRRGLEPRLFEIGYGTGMLLKQACDAGFPVGGIEVSPTMRDEALRRLGRGHDERLCVGDFLQRDLAADCRPSLVYWNDVFEHIPPDEIRDYLQHIRKLLVRGGQLVTITPNWHMRPFDVTRAFRPPRTESEGLHLKEYPLREVRRLLVEAGFCRVASPLLITSHRVVLCGSGLVGLKCRFEPTLECVPYWLARLVCRGFGLSITIATK